MVIEIKSEEELKYPIYPEHYAEADMGGSSSFRLNTLIPIYKDREEKYYLQYSVIYYRKDREIITESDVKKEIDNFLLLSQDMMSNYEQDPDLEDFTVYKIVK
jgi:hypothetical protein